jgi:integration host factor subunit alpha
LKSNFNKEDISLILSKKTGLSTNYSKKLINDLIELITSILKKDNLILKNLGSFRIIHKNKRIGRNPKTKKEYVISARKTISFKASNNINKKLKIIT